jgi:hypothetical protein
MAILSGKKARNGPSSGHDFDRIKEKLYGSMRSKVNRMKEVYSTDYIYRYKPSSDDDDAVSDGEIGTNKMLHRIHDMDWCNCEKNEHHEMNRFFDTLEDNGSDDLSDILNSDGSINMSNLADLLDGEGNYDE